MSMAPGIRAAFAAFPDPARQGLDQLRALILATAAEAGIPVTEALRWGQPAYLAPKGSTLRLGIPKQAAFALFAHCQTTLIEDFRAGPGAGHRIEGTRAVLFDDPAEIDPDALRPLIRHALTYHQRR
jgi:hypothetical protein